MPLPKTFSVPASQEQQGDQLPIFLTPLVPTDAQAVHAIISTDKHLADMTVVIPWPYTLSDAQGFIEFATGAAAAAEDVDHPETSSTIYAIRLGDPESALVGCIEVEVRPILQGACSLATNPYPGRTWTEWLPGYWLDRQVRGQGIMTRVIGRIKELAADDACVARVRIDCFAENPASRKVAERAGFQLEGLIRNSAARGGVIKDTYQLSWIPPSRHE
ncbi:acyl-CoA N-acyltransferase [Blastocladiella britannica]|nr:acyl-CoA N-acyltransferase [Blastocladiella britannica]